MDDAPDLERWVTGLVGEPGWDGFEHGGVCALGGFGPDRSGAIASVDANIDRSELARFRAAELRRSIRETAPAIVAVHSSDWGAGEAAILARLDGASAVVHIEHGAEGAVMPPEPWRRNSLCRLAFEASDRVICGSQQLKEHDAARARVDPSRITVVHAGVNAGRFRPDGEARARARRKLSVRDEEFCIGCVRKLLSAKDQMTVLRAVAQLGGASTQWRLMVAEEEIEHRESEIRVAAASGGSLSMEVMAAADEPVEFFNALDAFVLPSSNNGIPIPLLEAMATGVPVVAASAGGNCEVIRHGLSGLMFEPGNTLQLAEQLLRLHISVPLRREVGQGARRRAEQDFSIADTVRDYKRVFEELVPEQHGPEA